MVRRTWRRACTLPRLAKVIRCSASGRTALAFASVVRIRSCWNSWEASVPSIRRSWSGPLPRRGPFRGFGTLVLPQREPELVELGLDLVDGLLAEVPDVHELGLALLDEVAHDVDALS